MTPDEQADLPSQPPDEFQGDLRVNTFVQLEPIEELTEYDGSVLSYLARGPCVGPDHGGEWFIFLREGGRYFRPSAQGDAMERWLAVPSSAARVKQATSGHVSLLEVIGFSEWRPYRLSGSDPFHPERAEALPIRAVPHSYFPSGTVSIYGQRIENLDLQNIGGPEQLLVHLVPGKREVTSPSLWQAASIQRALEDFIESTPTFRRLEAHGFADIDSTPEVSLLGQTPRGAIDWAHLGALRVTQGTLLLKFDMGTLGLGSNTSIRRALPDLAPIAVDLSEVTVKVATESPSTARTSVALLSLGSLVEALGLSLLVAWAGDNGPQSAMISPLSANEASRLLARRARQGYKDDSTRSMGVRIELTPDEAEKLSRAADPRQGGFESLLADLKEGLRKEDDHFVLLLRPDQIERVIRYVQNYGTGGAQVRMKPIYEQLRRLGPSFGLLR